MHELTTVTIRSSAAAFILIAFAGSASAQTSTWEIDPAHTNAQFSVRHLMISNVRGEFVKTTGTVNFDEKDISRSSAEVVIDVTTINTREPRRDTHLKSPDFFDVAKITVDIEIVNRVPRAN